LGEKSRRRKKKRRIKMARVEKKKRLAER